MFFLVFPVGPVQQRFGYRVDPVAVRGGRPEQQAAVAVEGLAAARMGRGGGGVGQDDHRRLQPLGAVDGADPHLVAAPLVELPLHLRLAAPEPLQKP